MPKYRVQFEETITYDVTFESELSKEELAVCRAWFEAMDEADPDWFRTGLTGVTERELTEEIETVP